VLRRAFLGSLAGGLLATPLVAEAQLAAKVPVVGMLDYGAPDAARLAWWKALREALQELGYVEGRSIAFEARWAEGRIDRLASQRNWYDYRSTSS
jgi:putative ABC transport system substrate-binding protein